MKTKTTLVSPTGDTDTELINAFLSQVSDISNLAKIRSALSLGASTEVRNKAEGALNREINKRVTSLATNLVECFRRKDEEAKA